MQEVALGVGIGIKDNTLFGKKGENKMSNKEKIENFVRIDALLHQKLEELKRLDEERDIIIAEAEKSKTISESLQTKMQNNLEKYENLAEEIKELKKLAMNIN